MATREKIEMDFKRAIRQADKIDSIANRLGTLSGEKFGGSMQNLSACWKGENASLYLGKGGRLQGKMNGTANELHAIARDIRTVAKRLYNAEMAALAIASSRTYH